MQQRYEVEAFGIDANAEMIAAATDLYPNCRFAVARAEHAPYGDQQFDAIFICMAFHHLDDRQGFADEAARLMKPGGRLYIIDPAMPKMLRKVINSTLVHRGIAGGICSPREMAKIMMPHGFLPSKAVKDAYAQLVVFRRKRIE